VGATAAALAAGVTLVALDGLCTRHTEDTAAQQAAGGDRCLESFQGAVPGYTLLGVGGALAALTVYLFVRDHRRRSTMEQKSSAPPPGSALGKPYVWLGQGMVGVSTTATFH